MLKIFLTNLGKYNEGFLIGEWVELPADDDELEEVYQRIGINEEYEETFITDYETDIDGLEVSEYANIDSLNEMAETLDSLDDYDKKIVSAMLSNGYNLENAIEKIDDCMVYCDCYDMEDVAREYCDECGILDSIPENLQYYFDYEAFGRDMSFKGEFVFVGSDCVEIC